jgi:hypothetical protein
MNQNPLSGLRGESMDDNTIAASVSYLIGVLQARATRRDLRARTERKKRK